MKPLDKRQRLLLLGLLGVLAIIVVLLLIPAFAHKDEPMQESVVAVIPEADLAEQEDSKTDSYRKGGIGKYWDALEENGSAATTEGTQPDREEPRRDSRRPPQMVVDDIFGDYKDAAPEKEPEQRPKQRRAAGGDGAAHSRQAGSAPAAPREDPPAEEQKQEEAPVPTRVQVKRSGAVSSLDEDVSSDLGNGFSTLDGTDQWVGGEAGKPYRCMFTRDEKVKSGQRITVRLLEDLVIGGVHVPRNTHLQGVVSVSDRMEVSISSLDVGGRILSFHFEAYDTDGCRGIYCSDLSKTRKEVTEQGIATASSTLNTALGRVARDAASVGASIVRGKNGEATVSIPAGYTFYIIEEQR